MLEVQVVPDEWSGIAMLIVNVMVVMAFVIVVAILVKDVIDARPPQ